MQLAQAATRSTGEALLRGKRLHGQNFRWRLGKRHGGMAGPAAASWGIGGGSTAKAAAHPDGDEDSPVNLPRSLPRGNFFSHRKPLIQNLRNKTTSLSFPLGHLFPLSGKRDSPKGRPVIRVKPLFGL